MTNAQRLAIQLGGTCDLNACDKEDLRDVWNALNAPQIAWLLVRVGRDLLTVVGPVQTLANAEVREIIDRELSSKSPPPIQAYNMVARFLQYREVTFLANLYRSAFTYEEVLGDCLSTIGS